MCKNMYIVDDLESNKQRMCKTFECYKLFSEFLKFTVLDVCQPSITETCMH